MIAFAIIVLLALIFIRTSVKTAFFIGVVSAGMFVIIIMGKAGNSFPCWSESSFVGKVVAWPDPACVSDRKP